MQCPSRTLTASADYSIMRVRNIFVIPRRQAARNNGHEYILFKPADPLFRKERIIMGKKVDVLCIGTVVVDIMAKPIGQKQVWKEKQRISQIQILAGGDGANQSLYLTDSGLKTAFVGCVGDDQNGQIIKQLLHKRGVLTDFMQTRREYPTGTAIVLVDEKGERHTFSVYGAHSTISGSDCPITLPEGCKAVTLGSLFAMPELEKYGKLEELLQIYHAQGALTFADLAPDKEKAGLAGIERFLPHLDYFIPSVYDALEMTGVRSVEEAAALYRSKGAKNVIIKCGEKGCFYDTGDCSGWIPAIQVRTVDTTGAGDCMVALFVSRILSGDDVETACRYACAGASYSTLFPGASAEQVTPERIKGWLRLQPGDKALEALSKRI